MKDLIFFGIPSIVSVIALIISWKSYSNQFNPLLILKCNLEDSELEWDKSIMDELNCDGEYEYGLSKVSIDKKIILKIENKGIKPATDIILNYTIKTFKNHITYGIDEADILKYKRVKYKYSNRKIKIDYLAPEDSIEYVLFFVSNFPKIKIKVSKLKSKESSFISNKIALLVYDNMNHVILEDSQSVREAIGA